jgi:hypothetical protein
VVKKEASLYARVTNIKFSPAVGTELVRGAQVLTTLPVGAEYPGKSGGPNFEFYRTCYPLPHRHAAWVLMHERLLELAVYCARLGAWPSAPAELTTIEGTFRKLVRALEQHIG